MHLCELGGYADALNRPVFVNVWVSLDDSV